MDSPIQTTSPSETLRQWIIDYSDALYTRAFYKTSNKETAEDLVQDTFFAALEAIPKFEFKSQPKTWLISILNNKIAEYYRKAYKGALQPESRQGFRNVFDIYFDENEEWQKDQQPTEWQIEQSNLLDDEGFLRTLQNCMNKLPEAWSAAIQLKYLEEKKGEIICQELKLSSTNFWQILHRAKLQLRKCLELNWFNLDL